MMVKRPLYYFLNVSNFFNYLTAIFLLRQELTSVVKIIIKPLSKPCKPAQTREGGMKEFA